MGNSSIQVRTLVDEARAFAEIAPVLPTGGYSLQPALSITNDTMGAMLMGSPNGEPFNWKWNRILVPPFYLNSYQQDYFIPGLVALGWLESGYAVNQSSTVTPKPVRPIEVKRDVLLTSAQTGNLAKASWMQVDTMVFGTWGQSQAVSGMGLINPGPGVVYTDPTGLTSMPSNPITCIKDSFGNFWVVTHYGTCGNTNPFATNQNPNGVFPTLQSPNIVPVTVNDGTVVWTAVNPKGQGIRVNPLPTQTGPSWQVNLIGQARVPFITQLSQYIDPVPDDYYYLFKQGFFAQCFRRSPDLKVRAKFPEEWAIWLKSLDNSVKQGSREMDDWGFVPASNVMDTGWAFNPVNPAMPYGPWAG